MYNLSELYYPITANPKGAGEILPCKALRPYIRCFWGSSFLEETYRGEPEKQLNDPSAPSLGGEIIIPDSCMDIIWEWDEQTGESGGIFCGINDTPFEAGQAHDDTGKIRFAIRFHFWAVHLFADDHLREVLNIHTGVDQYFGSFRSELGDKLPGTRTVAERIALVEAYLLRQLEKIRYSNDGMLNAVYAIVKSKGVISVAALEGNSGFSSRQLERLFREYIGISPKKTADLVRFQNVWLDLYRTPPQNRNIQDVVYSYGYSHQSHLNNNFKKFAGRTPLEALAYARN
ncbi:helix-turn-helix domain-containing protein [Paenibacillus sp. FSL L8-0340]|uniref:helix-turn-helix domain-containing protein n=1 Tax=Paenibacillus sp. FSL L8-0340 TaxID=2954685 RepID=UPI0031589197